jgi:hypothetical protein
MRKKSDFCAELRRVLRSALKKSDFFVCVFICGE